jgi:L-iditol 2-dehydrogenase
LIPWPGGCRLSSSRAFSARNRLFAEAAIVKALVLNRYGQLDYQDVPEPTIGPGEVLIEVRACGICGSDVHGMDGSTGRRRPPVIMGHEASGVIARVGAAVSGWATGTRVTFDSTIWCGECAACRAGRINLCGQRRVLGVSCDEYRQHGAFAQYVAVPQHILYRMPDGLSFEHAAMVEPVSVAVHAVDRLPIALGDTGLVIGTGMIGLLVVQALRAAGCGRIIAADVNPQRLALAGQLGADEQIRSDQVSLADEVLRLTGGRGADVALEVVGAAATVRAAVLSLRRGGHLTLVGNVSPTVELPLQAVVTRELTLYGTCASCGEYPACLELMQRETIGVAPLLSAVAPLAEGAVWFDRLYRGEPGLMKVVLQP